MSRSLEDIIAECDRRMAECEITSPTDEIKRLKEELARKQRELDEIKSRMIESEKIVREYAIIQEIKRRQEEEYFSKFSRMDLTVDTVSGRRLSYSGNILRIAIRRISYPEGRGYNEYTYYLTDSGYLVIFSGIKIFDVISVHDDLTTQYLTLDDKERLKQKGCGSCGNCFVTRYGLFCESVIKKPCRLNLNWLKIQIQKMYPSDNPLSA